MGRKDIEVWLEYISYLKAVQFWALPRILPERAEKEIELSPGSPKKNSSVNEPVVSFSRLNPRANQHFHDSVIHDHAV